MITNYTMETTSCSYAEISSSYSLGQLKGHHNLKLPATVPRQGSAGQPWARCAVSAGHPPHPPMDQTRHARPRWQQGARRQRTTHETHSHIPSLAHVPQRSRNVAAAKTLPRACCPSRAHRLAVHQQRRRLRRTICSRCPHCRWSAHQLRPPPRRRPLAATGPSPNFAHSR